MIFFFTSQEIYRQIRSFPQRTRAAQKLPSKKSIQSMGRDCNDGRGFHVRNHLACPEWLDKIYPRKILGAEPSALEITTGIVGATIVVTSPEWSVRRKLLARESSGKQRYFLDIRPVVGQQVISTRPIIEK